MNSGKSGPAPAGSANGEKDRSEVTAPSPATDIRPVRDTALSGVLLLKLYAVRHAQVVIQPSVPPEQWHLSPEGLTSARRLTVEHPWPGVTRVWHSPQRKTVQTAQTIAQALGIPTESADGLAELTLDAGFLGTAEFERRIGAFLEGADDPAFEPYEQAQARIVGCVRDILAHASGDAAAIVSHGRILTVLFSALCGVRLGRADWQSLRLPDLAVVDLDRGRVQSGFFAGKRIDPRILLG